MSKALDAFRQAGIPSVDDLKQSLTATASKVAVQGKLLLRMDRMGVWIYGPDDLAVEEGVLVAFNPASIRHGAILWEDGAVKDERMAPITQPDPWIADGLATAPADWKQQMAIDGVLVGGVDDGEEVTYKTTSLGGREALGLLASDIAMQLDQDPERPVPVVELHNTHYKHREYGRVYKPVLVVRGWIGFDEDPHTLLGLSGEKQDVPKDDEPSSAPIRRRRSRS